MDVQTQTREGNVNDLICKERTRLERTPEDILRYPKLRSRSLQAVIAESYQKQRMPHDTQHYEHWTHFYRVTVGLLDDMYKRHNVGTKLMGPTLDHLRQTAPRED